MRALVFACVVLLCLGACADILGIGDLPPLSADAGEVDDASGPTTDASKETDADADASCDLRKPFGQPTYVPGIEPHGVNGHPWLTPDEKTLYFSAFSAERSPEDFHIFMGTRGDRSVPFGNVTKVDGVNGTTSDLEPTLSDDERTIVFVRSGGLGDSYDLWRSTRSDARMAFDPPTPLSTLDTMYDEHLPSLGPNGQLWFSSGRDSPDAGVHIYVATLEGDTFTGATVVGELRSPFDDSGSVSTADGKTIFFGSSRPAPGTRGGRDIWTARRERIDAPFGDVTLVENLNTANDDTPGWVSPDGCRLYYTSLHDIFVAVRPR